MYFTLFLLCKSFQLTNALYFTSFKSQQNLSQHDYKASVCTLWTGRAEFVMPAHHSFPETTTTPPQTHSAASLFYCPGDVLPVMHPSYSSVQSQTLQGSTDVSFLQILFIFIYLVFCYSLYRYVCGFPALPNFGSTGCQ